MNNQGMKFIRITGISILSVAVGLVVLSLILINSTVQNAPIWTMIIIAFFGIYLGYIMYAVGTRRRCPQCREMSDFQAKICPHCHSTFLANPF